MLAKTIHKINQEFLREAKNSPSLLSDMAAMERYMSESYSGRILVELLQNADDAESSLFYVGNRGSLLFVANNGRPFNEADVLSISRSGASNKKRGDNIGYRGIGFKSTSFLTNEITIYSNGTYFSFSKELTANALNLSKDNVPTIRIPFLVDRDDYASIVEEYQLQGYTTFFFFALANIELIKDEISSLSPDTMLFLKHLEKIDIDVDSIKKKYKTTRKSVEWGKEVVIAGSKWGIVNNTIALKIEDDTFAASEDDAYYYSFLPTYDKTPYPVKINADFSTDPSRKHIILDEKTKHSLDSVADTIVDIIQRCLEKPLHIFKHILEIFSSNSSFSTTSVYLKTAITDRLNQKAHLLLNNGTSISLSEYLLFGADIEMSVADIIRKQSPCVIESSLPETIYATLLGVDRFIAKFSKNYYGYEDLINIMSEEPFVSSVSDYVYSYLLGKIVNLHFKSKFLSDAKPDESKLLIKTQEGAVKLNNLQVDSSALHKILNLNESNYSITHSMFESFIIDNGIKQTESSEKVENNSIIPSWRTNITPQYEKTIKNSSPMIAKWRSAEVACVEIERFLGNEACDVSRQNLGYDVESTTQDSVKRYIEVKLIDKNSSSFCITNNEYTAAHQYGKNYYLCLIEKGDTESRAVYIQDPLNTLHFEKRIRQWEWYCDSYEGEIIKIEY